jgi:HlyD family secretion protein
LEETELKCTNLGAEVARLQSYAESCQTEAKSLRAQLASASEEINAAREFVAKTNAELERVRKRAKISVANNDEITRLKAEAKIAQASLDRAVASQRKAKEQLEELQAKAQKAEILEAKVSAMEEQITQLRATRTRLTAALEASDIKVRPKVESKAPFSPHD